MPRPDAAAAPEAAAAAARRSECRALSPELVRVPAALGHAAQALAALSAAICGKVPDGQAPVSAAATAAAVAAARLDDAAASVFAASELLAVFEAPERHLELALTLQTTRSVRRRFFGCLEDTIAAACKPDRADLSIALRRALEQWRGASNALSSLCSVAWELHTYFVFLDVKGDKALLEVTVQQLCDLLGCGGARELAQCLEHTGQWVSDSLRGLASQSLGPMLARRHAAALQAWRQLLARRSATLSEHRRAPALEVDHGMYFWDAYFSNLYHISWADFAEAFEEFYLQGRCPVDVLDRLRRRVDPLREHRVRRCAWLRVTQAVGPEGGSEAIVDLLLGEVLEDIMSSIFRPEPLEYVGWPDGPPDGAATSKGSPSPSLAGGSSQAARSLPPGKAAAHSSKEAPGGGGVAGAAGPHASAGRPQLGQISRAGAATPSTADPACTPNPRQQSGVPLGQLEEPEAARATPLGPRGLVGPHKVGPRMQWSELVQLLASRIRPWYRPAGPEASAPRKAASPLCAEAPFVAALRAVTSSVAYTQRVLVLRVVSGDLGANRPLLSRGPGADPTTPEEEPLPALVITAHDSRFSGVTKFGRGSSRRTLLPDMQMDEPIASRSHFSITYRQQDDRFCLMDAGSKWGTFVKIGEAVPLSCGDWIRVGNVEFVIRFCGGGCACRSSHSHYKLHSLRIQNDHQQQRGLLRGLIPAFPPMRELAAGCAADPASPCGSAGLRDGSSSPVRPALAEQAAGEDDLSLPGACNRGEAPQIADGVHLLLSGIRGAAWLAQSARLCKASALPGAGLTQPASPSRPARAAIGEAASPARSPADRAASSRSGAPQVPPTHMPVPPLELDFISGPRTGERVTLVDRRSTMGRGEAATIQVSDPMLANVSRIHCVFEYINDRWHIRDNGSTNGTWRRLSCVLEPSRPMPLTGGMSILAGVHEFRVEEGTLGQWCLPSAASAVLEEMGSGA